MCELFKRLTLVNPSNQSNLIYKFKKTFKFNSKNSSKKISELGDVKLDELSIVETIVLTVTDNNNNNTINILEGDCVFLSLDSPENPRFINVKKDNIILGQIKEPEASWLIPFLKANRSDIFSTKIYRLCENACDANGITIDIHIVKK